MNNERRRSERHALLREEIAIVHDILRDRPATLVEFSSTGALISLVDHAGMPEFRSREGDYVEVSLQSDVSYFYAKAKIVRRGLGFIALEFAETRPESLRAIEAKIERLVILQGPPRTRAAGAGTLF